MKVTIHSDRRLLERILIRQERIEWKLEKLLQGQGIAQMSLDDLKAKVQAEQTVVASVVTLLGELKALVEAAKADPAKIDELAAMIDANKDALAAAVTANTPTP